MEGGAGGLYCYGATVSLSQLPGWGNSQAASVQSLTWVSVGGTFVPTRTQNFHHFLKLALTKNPKKRPTAEKLLQVGGRGWPRELEAQRKDLEGRGQLDQPLLPQHPFTTQQLPRALLTQLLDKASDPHLGTLSPEDCELEVTQGLGAGSAPPGWQGPAGDVNQNLSDLWIPAQRL